MIGRLTGQLSWRGADHVMIDVGGVGYLVYCSERTLMSLPHLGSRVSLYTDLLVREDLLQLFGFTSLVEKEWYRLLLTVQGVGAKAALGILGTLGPDGVSRAIALGDMASVKAAPGVGPKIAQRVVNELRDKAPTVMAMSGNSTAPRPAPDQPATMDADPVILPDPVEPATSLPSGAASAEALSALSNLGYSPSDAAGAVARASTDDPQATTESLIRAALRLLAPKD